jgi:hypothetical protein
MKSNKRVCNFATAKYNWHTRPSRYNVQQYSKVPRKNSYSHYHYTLMYTGYLHPATFSVTVFHIDGSFIKSVKFSLMHLRITARNVKYAWLFFPFRVLMQGKCKQWRKGCLPSKMLKSNSPTCTLTSVTGLLIKHTIYKPFPQVHSHIRCYLSLGHYPYKLLYIFNSLYPCSENEILLNLKKGQQATTLILYDNNLLQQYFNTQTQRNFLVPVTFPDDYTDFMVRTSIT